jgi:hypothetical protein
VTQMIDTSAALDAIIRSVESGTPVAVGGP